MRFSDLDSALDYLYGFTNYENLGRVDYTRSNYDLDRMRQMLEWFGNPDRQIPVKVHVAGTKGKGSTSILVAALLNAAGKRTGLYTSPHLEDIRERIQVGSELISPNALRDRISALREYLERPRDGLAPTFFDIFTTIALLEFARQKCDAAVVEVGLGGRLDSTNVIEPSVTAITPVHYDHTDKLGDRLSQIASEKAGILKAGAPAVIGAQADEAAEVIKNRIEELEVPAWWLGRDIRIENDSVPEQTFDVVTPAGRHNGLRSRALGRHQRENAAVALGICDLLAETSDIRLPEGCEAEVLSSLQLPGRIEVFGDGPPIVLDGAHNAFSAAVLAETVRAAFQYRRLFLVLGIAADKAVREVVGLLAPLAYQVFATAAPSPRALAPAELARAVRQVTGSRVSEVADPLDALEQARKEAGPEDLIVIAGSFYLAGELRPALRELSP